MGKLDRLFDSAPAADTFTVPIGEGEDDFLTFRRVHDFTDLERKKREAVVKARKVYDAFVDRTDGAQIDEDRVQTLSQCVLMADLAAEPGEGVSIESLYRLSTKWGAVFAGLVHVFGARMAMDGAAAFQSEVEAAKND